MIDAPVLQPPSTEMSVQNAKKIAEEGPKPVEKKRHIPEWLVEASKKAKSHDFRGAVQEVAKRGKIETIPYPSEYPTIEESIRQETLAEQSSIYTSKEYTAFRQAHIAEQRQRAFFLGRVDENHTPSLLSSELVDNRSTSAWIPHSSNTEYELLQKFKEANPDAYAEAAARDIYVGIDRRTGEQTYDPYADPEVINAEKYILDNVAGKSSDEINQLTRDTFSNLVSKWTYAKAYAYGTVNQNIQNANVSRIADLRLYAINSQDADVLSAVYFPQTPPFRIAYYAEDAQMAVTLHDRLGTDRIYNTDGSSTVVNSIEDWNSADKAIRDEVHQKIVPVDSAQNVVADLEQLRETAELSGLKTIDFTKPSVHFDRLVADPIYRRECIQQAEIARQVINALSNPSALPAHVRHMIEGIVQKGGGISPETFFYVAEQTKHIATGSDYGNIEDQARLDIKLLKIAKVLSDGFDQAYPPRAKTRTMARSVPVPPQPMPQPSPDAVVDHSGTMTQQMRQQLALHNQTYDRNQDEREAGINPTSSAPEDHRITTRQLERLQQFRDQQASLRTDGQTLSRLDRASLSRDEVTSRIEPANVPLANVEQTIQAAVDVLAQPRENSRSLDTLAIRSDRVSILRIEDSPESRRFAKKGAEYLGKILPTLPEDRKMNKKQVKDLSGVIAGVKPGALMSINLAIDTMAQLQAQDREFANNFDVLLTNFNGIPAALLVRKEKALQVLKSYAKTDSPIPTYEQGKAQRLDFLKSNPQKLTSEEQLLQTELRDALTGKFTDAETVIRQTEAMLKDTHDGKVWGHGIPRDMQQLRDAVAKPHRSAGFFKRHESSYFDKISAVLRRYHGKNHDEYTAQVNQNIDFLYNGMQYADDNEMVTWYGNGDNPNTEKTLKAIEDVYNQSGIHRILRRNKIV